MQRGLIFSIVEIFHFLDGVSGFNHSDLINIILYLSPPLIVESRDGWWLRVSLPSYNLDIQVWGPIYAMWGASQDPNSGTQGWLSEYGPEDADYEGINGVQYVRKN